MTDAIQRVQHEVRFWDNRSPRPVRHAIERAVQLLLPRETGETAKLVYAGAFAGRDPHYRIRLCFEATTPVRQLYSFSLEATAGAGWNPALSFTEHCRHTFLGWTTDLWVTAEASPPDAASTARYAVLVAEALAEEQAQAERREDDAPIAAVRRAVLDALDAGKTCSGRSNKEGQTNFYRRDGVFIQDHVGDWDEQLMLATEAEMLAALRRFFDWDARAETYPHPPPELAVWRYIQRQLR